MKMAKMLIPVAALLAAAPMAQAQQAGVQAGVLSCSVVPGTRLNLLIRSTADVDCIYENQGKTEKYRGETGIALGLDLSFKDNEQFAFTVLAASADVMPGAHSLAGKYVGGQAGASAGVGVSASVLVGGGEKNVSLQPLVVGTNTGLGASAGIGFLYIEAAK
jgi:hypothetical protein